MNRSLIIDALTAARPRRAASVRTDSALMAEALAVCLPRRVRRLREWAEEEIILPDPGPRAGSAYDCSWMPWTGLALDEIQSGGWQRCIGVGPSQSGKTFLFFVMPVLHTLFELQESVIVGVPIINTALGIWRERLEPVIKRSSYRDLLPTRGQGSKGGHTTVIYFRNGTSLRFMAAGGSDAQRVSHTARVIAVTEMELLQTPGDASREASPLHSFEARSRAFGDLATFYGEGIAGQKETIAWQEAMVLGSGTEILARCPHCEGLTKIERKQLQGWQDAQTVIEAREKARLACGKCAVLWTEDDRLEALKAPHLIHRGQTIDKAGKIRGARPATLTFGLNWTALHTPMTTIAKVAEEEWKAQQSEAEKDIQALHQFTWAIPFTPGADAAEGATLSANAIRERTSGIEQGLVPSSAEKLVVCVDVHQRACYWAAVGWAPSVIGFTVDYGVAEVHDDPRLAPEQSLLQALRTFRDEQLTVGWPMHSAEETPEAAPKHRVPDLVLVDSGWNQEVIFALARETKIPRLMPCKGFGSARGQGRWWAPKKSVERTPGAGGEWYISHKRGEPKWVGMHDDHWKRWIHQRFLVPPLTPGSVVLFEAETRTKHLAFSKHITAEKEVERWTPQGRITEWKRQSHNNHWLDVMKMCGLAAEMLGIRIISRASPQPPTPRPPRPSGRGRWLSRRSGRSRGDWKRRK